MRISHLSRGFRFSLVLSALMWAVPVRPASQSDDANPAGNEKPPKFKSVEQGRDHLRWEAVSGETNGQGAVSFRTNSYVELETGKNYKQQGRWLPSREHIAITATNAAALEGNHKAFFAPNVSTVGALDLLTSDNKRLRSRILGIAYYDYKTNRSVLIAELQDSIGVLVGENQVIYTN